jgi:hypothetical protein
MVYFQPCFLNWLGRVWRKGGNIMEISTFFKGGDTMYKKLFSRFNFIILVPVLMLTFSKIGFAQGMEALKKPQSGVEFITMFDKNKDGKVSKQEFSGDDFTSMDKNTDGFIVIEEADQNFNPPEYSVNANQIAFIVKFDENKDGKLSNEEFTGSHFSEFDENGDGFIEPHEAPEGETAY